MLANHTGISTVSQKYTYTCAHTHTHTHTHTGSLVYGIKTQGILKVFVLIVLILTCIHPLSLTFLDCMMALTQTYFFSHHCCTTNHSLPPSLLLPLSYIAVQTNMWPVRKALQQEGIHGAVQEIRDLQRWHRYVRNGPLKVRHNYL